MSNEKPTVFLVDDDKSVRDAIAWLIESVGLNVQSFESATDFLETYDATQPGCLVLDVRMPGMSGLELQQQLATRRSGIPIIIVTGHGDVPMCIRAFENGAFAFLEKPVNHQALLDYIQRALEEDRNNRLKVGAGPDIDYRINLLTAREKEVMELLVSGKTMKQIAADLEISIQTCSKHRAKVLEKLQVGNDVELVHLVLTGNSTVSKRVN